jgi:excisionase family DNA binding protein
MSVALPLPDDFLDALVERVQERLQAGRRWQHIEGVAEYLGCEVSRVRALRERGLPATRLGKRLLFDLDEVDAWIEQEGVRA